MTFSECLYASVSPQMMVKTQHRDKGKLSVISRKCLDIIEENNIVELVRNTRDVKKKLLIAKVTDEQFVEIIAHRLKVPDKFKEYEIDGLDSTVRIITLNANYNMSSFNLDNIKDIYSNQIVIYCIIPIDPIKLIFEGDYESIKLTRGDVYFYEHGMDPIPMKESFKRSFILLRFIYTVSQITA